MENVILQNLSIGYATKDNRKVVANGMSAAVQSGQLTCLLGRNGVGKSTLLRTLSAFQPPLSGDILITSEHRPLRDYSDSQLSRIIGVVLTEKPEVRNMTVDEMVGGKGCFGLSSFYFHRLEVALVRAGFEGDAASRFDLVSGF